MSKKAERPQSRRHIQIYDQDWDYLNKRFIYPGPIVRQMVHLAVKALRQRELDRADASGPGAKTIDQIAEQQLQELTDE